MGARCCASQLIVGIGKELKNCVLDEWENWMMEQGAGTAVFKPPSRRELVTWIVTLLESMSPQMVKNSWCRGEYSYFETADKDTSSEATVESIMLAEQL